MPQPDNPELVTADFLNAKYRPFQHRLPFPRTRDADDWVSWRRDLRLALHDVLALDRLGDVPTPAPEIVESEQCDEYTRHLIRYETMPGNCVEAFLLIPDSGPEKKSAVICPHGHIEGHARGVVDPAISTGAAYGHELAQRGMIVLAPYNAGNGVRDMPPGSLPFESCQLLWARLNHLGLDIAGFRVFELMAGLNLLCAREDVRTDRIGAAGLSGGCWLSHLLAALDKRVRAVILSSFFTTFEQTVWIDHCICHHPKGIGEVCELYDIAALIAPRPLFVESGIHDLPYPIEPAFEKTREAYQLLDAEPSLHLDRYEGTPDRRHMFHGTHSIPWLAAELMG